MKIGEKKIKLIDIPKQKEKFREAFRHKFKGYLSKSPLVWLGDVVIGAGCMWLHAPATSILNCTIVGTVMTVGGAIGGIPLAFAGGLAGGWLGEKFGKSAKSVKRSAIIGSFALGGLGIAGGNFVGYKMTNERFLDHGDHKKEHFNDKAAKPAAADEKNYIVEPPFIPPHTLIYPTYY